MKKVSTLNHISILSFAFVAMVVIINLFTTNNYGRSNSAVVSMMQEDYLLDYHRLYAILSSGSNDYLFVDLRKEDVFEKGHLPGSVNIPMNELLERSHLRTLRRSGEKTLVLYADHEATAHSARYLLLSGGLDVPVKVMAGNYEMAVDVAVEVFQPAYAAYKDEKARFDYRRYMGGAVKSTEPAKPAGIIPEVSQQTLGSQGGC